MLFPKILRSPDQKTCLIFSDYESEFEASDYFHDAERTPSRSKVSYIHIKGFGRCVILEDGLQTSLLSYTEQQKSLPTIECLLEWWRMYLTKEKRGLIVPQFTKSRLWLFRRDPATHNIIIHNALPDELKWTVEKKDTFMYEREMNQPFNKVLLMKEYIDVSFYSDESIVSHMKLSY